MLQVDDEPPALRQARQPPRELAPFVGILDRLIRRLDIVGRLQLQAILAVGQLARRYLNPRCIGQVFRPTDPVTQALQAA